MTRWDLPRVSRKSRSRHRSPRWSTARIGARLMRRGRLFARGGNGWFGYLDPIAVCDAIGGQAAIDTATAPLANADAQLLVDAAGLLVVSLGAPVRRRPFLHPPS